MSQCAVLGIAAAATQKWSQKHLLGMCALSVLGLSLDRMQQRHSRANGGIVWPERPSSECVQSSMMTSSFDSRYSIVSNVVRNTVGERDSLDYGRIDVLDQ